MKSSHSSLLLSLLAVGLFVLAGCTGGDQVVSPDIEKGTEGKYDAHAHGHHGPHDGDVIELGDEMYHAELVHAGDTVTIYILDGEVKNAIPIDAEELMINLIADGKPKQFKLAAKPQEKDPEGKSSRFELVDGTLLHAIEEEGAKPRLSFNIGDKAINAEFALHGHGDHGHGDHDDHGDHKDGHDDHDDHDAHHGEHKGEGHDDDDHNHKDGDDHKEAHDDEKGHDDDHGEDDKHADEKK